MGNTMQKIMVLLVVFGLMVSGSGAAAQQSKSATCTLKVTGMTCAGCEAAVKIAAKRVDGVKEIVVSYDKAAAHVTYDPAKTTPAAIAKAITDKTGYKANPQPKK